MKFSYVILFLFIGCYPFTDSTTEELMGPDKNNDEVRDDIGEWIDSLSDEFPENYLLALKQYAKYLRESFKYRDDKEKSIKNTYLESYSSNCVYIQMSKIAGKYLADVQYYNIKKDQLINKNQILSGKIKKFPSENLKNEQEENHKEYLKLIKKYEPISKKRRDLLEIERFHTNKIYKMVYDSMERRNINNKIGKFFSGKTVFTTDDEKKVCYFLNKTNGKEE